jgi:penicillin-binding protein 2
MPERHNLLFPDINRSRHGGVDSVIPTIDETAAGPVGGAGANGEAPPSFIGVSLSPRRLGVFFGVCLSLFLALGARAAWLDLWGGERYRLLAEGNRLRILPIPAERGVIYDRDGNLLTRNIPDFTLTATPADLPRDEDARAKLLVSLSEIAGLTPLDIERILQRYPANYVYAVPIKEHLDYEKAVLLDVRSGTQFPGVNVDVGTKREYLLSGLKKKEPLLSLSHILGYEGRISETEYAERKRSGYLPSDLIGKTGVESSYESVLRGEYGRKQIEVDAFGREQTVLAVNDPVQGSDLSLTIDLDLQETAEHALRRAALLNGPGRGVAIAMDPQDGAVLALVSFPGYDANVFSRGISLDEYRALSEDPNQPLYPRAVSGLYPPGSTVKPVIAAAALAEGVITTTTSVLSAGGIRIGEWFFPDWKRGGHGWTGVTKAIAESVNTFFYTIGGGWEHIEGLGVDRLRDYLARFGLGSRLGLDLTGERDGFIPSVEWKERVKKEPWYIGDTYHLSIGQGDLLVTPIQVAAWTAVFANGGELVRPRVVEAIRSNGGDKALLKSVIGKDLVPADAIDTVRRGMRQTVVSGSARGLSLSPWTMAGKTGTAQWRTGQPNHAWFTGFAPYDDPEIVVTVLIEAGGEGSAAAAPVAREIMEAWLRKRKVPATNRPIDSATETPIN